MLPYFKIDLLVLNLLYLRTHNLGLINIHILIVRTNRGSTVLDLYLF